MLVQNNNYLEEETIVKYFQFRIYHRSLHTRQTIGTFM